MTAEWIHFMSFSPKPQNTFFQVLRYEQKAQMALSAPTQQRLQTTLELFKLVPFSKQPGYWAAVHFKVQKDAGGDETTLKETWGWWGWVVKCA